jgi:uncharacterized CHY-type Zn-finger protein
MTIKIENLWLEEKDFQGTNSLDTKLEGLRDPGNEGFRVLVDGGFKRPRLRPFHKFSNHQMLAYCEHFWACVTITNDLSKDLIILPNLCLSLWGSTKNTFGVRRMNKLLRNWRLGSHWCPYCNDPFKGDLSNYMKIGTP